MVISTPGEFGVCAVLHPMPPNATLERPAGSFSKCWAAFAWAMKAKPKEVQPSS